MIRVGERLLAAAELLGSCDILADIGANHGFLSAFMLQEGLCRTAVVSDISEDALLRARDVMREEGLLNKVFFNIGDGFQNISLKPGDGIAVCGMGARTIAHILRGGLPCKAVLQSNVELSFLREFISNSDMHIEKERIALDGGRYYVLMLVLPGRGKPYAPGECITGKRELLQNPQMRREYLAWRLRVADTALKGAKTGSDACKLSRAKMEYEAVSRALEEDG